MTKEYLAGIYIEDNGPQKESGMIIADGATITFKNDKRTITFFVNELQISFGGTANRIAFISHPGKPNIKLHTSDFSLFSEPAFAQNESAKSVVKGKKDYNASLLVVGVCMALLVLLPSYFVFIERSLLAGVISTKISPELEIQLGNYVYDLQFASNPDMIKDAEIAQDLKTLMAPLLALEKNSAYEFKVHILRSKEANALAIPGGHIVVFSGLIEQSEEPEELLGVIGHEMAHITQRHSLKQMIAELSGAVLLNIITAGAGDLVYILGDNARFLLGRTYSRKQEQEADIIGFKYLADAQISPHGLITFFQRLEEKSHFMDSGLLQIVSTHPSSKNRVHTLEKMLEEYESGFRDIQFDYAAFKQKVSLYQ